MPQTMRRPPWNKFDLFMLWVLFCAIVVLLSSCVASPEALAEPDNQRLIRVTLPDSTYCIVYRDGGYRSGLHCDFSERTK